MVRVRQEQIARFNERHDVGVEQQFKQLVEEVGELSEALNRNDEEAVAEELADIVFVARSLAELRDINISHCVNEVTHENLQKDETTDGQKVTKDGLREDDGETEPLVCWECGKGIEEELFDESEKMPDCPHCDENPFRPVGHASVETGEAGDEAVFLDCADLLREAAGQTDDRHVQVNISRALDLLESEGDDD